MSRLPKSAPCLMILAALAAGAACQSSTGGAASTAPHMRMTTEVPPGLATPDRLETELGTLTSFDGVPDAATTQKVYDNPPRQDRLWHHRHHGLARGSPSKSC